MRLGRSRQSGNIEDRRGMSRGVVGGGIGTVVILLVAYLFGIDPGTVNQVIENQPQASNEAGIDDAVKDTMSRILGDTEEVWHTKFSELGRTYEEPVLVLFTGQVQSACGFASAAMGPFYCPGDHKLYLDTSFFEEMSRRLGAPGDFARAYVVAHEVGHHVQTLLGISQQVQGAMQQSSQEEANAISVLQELQADCFAGIWANEAQKERQILEQGDIEEGLGAASAVGDDRIQQASQGYVVPESFTHGTSQQRMEWFMRGLRSGDVEQCDTFGEAGL